MSESVKFLTGWAADIRASSGTSVDADRLEEAAAIITSQAEEITLLRRQRDDAKADYVRRHKDAVDRYLEVQELRTALSETEQRARREALEEAAILAGSIGDEQIRSGSLDLEASVDKIIVAIRALIPSEPISRDSWAFAHGDYVCKKSGSWWAGRVVGTYATEQTPRGYAVQLDKPFGPVQIYPESALKRFIPSETRDAEARE